jgi:hypothetical protein
MDFSDEIISDINRILESTWSQSQLVKGKWFEINSFWSRQLIADLIFRYKIAGWLVTQHAEVTPGVVTKYLAFIHPNFKNL